LYNSKGKIFVFSAPSGAGKTTIIKNVLTHFPDLEFSISATTRSKRPNEIDGKDYFFISANDFKKKIERDEFLEWELFFDNYYGTLKDFVENKIESGKSIVLEVDVKGAISIKNRFREAVLIYILPPSIEELIARLSNRKTETHEELLKRIERAKMELSYKEKFDYVIVNNSLEQALREVKEIIKYKLGE